MHAPIVHWEINTRDPAKVQDFYRALFGWDIRVVPEMNYGLVVTGSKKGIDGGIGATREGSSNLVTVYAEVDKIQETLDKAVTMGAALVVPVTEIPGMVTFALFRDPDGNVMGLVERTAQPSPRRKRKKPVSTSSRRRKG